MKKEYTFIIYYDSYRQFKITCVNYDYCKMLADTFVNEVISKERLWKIERYYGNLIMADEEQ